jgi:hypothetical protein
VNWRIFGVMMLACGLLAWAIHRWLNVPFWLPLGIVILGLLINGWMAAIEDHW